MLNNFYSENVDFSNADALDILRIRTREILSIIYKLHCTDFTFIKELKPYDLQDISDRCGTVARFCLHRS